MFVHECCKGGLLHCPILKSQLQQVHEQLRSHIVKHRSCISLSQCSPVLWMCIQVLCAAEGASVLLMLDMQASSRAFTCIAMLTYALCLSLTVFLPFPAACRYFQELDFPWELDISLVLDLIPKVVQIVADEACTFYGFDKSQPQPQPLLSMRTPYKVHVNFPAIFTVEASAREVRKRIINRCRCELSGLQPLLLLREEAALQQQVLQARQALQQLPQDLQESLMQHLRRVENAEGQQLLDMLQEAAALDAADVTTAATDAEVADTKTDAEAAAVAAASADTLQQLDWESIIDSPHGSLRLLGSCKAPWMDSDPAWVQEKSYSEVQLVDGVWMRQPLSYAAVQQCSILLDAMEQRVFEQSQDFLEAVYQVRLLQAGARNRRVLWLISR
jgi:hypothetical protein